MLGVSTPEMAAAVSDQGGLGSLPVGGLSPDVIRQTKEMTDRPFAVNLFVHDIPACSETEVSAMQELLLKLAHKRGYPLDENDLSNFTFYTYQDQLEVLVDEKISVISFTFGCLDAPSIRLLQSKGMVLMGTATCVEEALFLEEKGIDMVVVQGIEAGGHRGTFMDHIPLPQVGLFSLLPQIAAAVQVPCIAAGGIYHGTTLKAAFESGAAGVQVGTAFIGTQESNAIPAYREKLATSTEVDSSLTRAFSGRWARGLRNQFMADIEESGIPIPPYPFQNSLTTKLRILAQQNNDAEYTNLWAGQSPVHIPEQSAKEVFRYFAKEFDMMNK